MRFSRFGLILLFLISTTIISQAQVPGQINFQGILETKDGTTLNDTYLMTFSLYYVPSGGDLPFWQDTLTVKITNDIYSVILGTTLNPIEADDLERDVYLGVAVGTDAEMTPRLKLTSTAFALKAAISEFAVDADTLDGQDATVFNQSAHVSDNGNPHNVTVTQIGALGTSVFDSHALNESAHHKKTDSFKDLYDVINDSQIPDEITRDNEMDKELSTKSDVSHTHDTRYYTQTEVDALVSNLQSQIDDLKALLLNVTREGNDITFSGVNVHIVNGIGTTSPNVNGLGNLIVGYNEMRYDGSDNRSGSHNIVVGELNNFSSYGGFISGYENTISNRYATVNGGTRNIAAGDYSNVSGGLSNKASGNYSSVTGGRGNSANGQFSSVSGGSSNESNSYDSSISGGTENIANGYGSSVSGGKERIAESTDDWAAGTLYEDH